MIKNKILVYVLHVLRSKRIKLMHEGEDDCVHSHDSSPTRPNGFRRNLVLKSLHWKLLSESNFGLR